MRVLPPEAYTNRELAQAYSWLMNQPEHIQRLGNTKESVISLFKRAVRGGEPRMGESAPVSSDTFQSDLRNLADGLKNFEGPQVQGRPYMPPVPANNAIEFDEKSWKMIQLVKSELNLSSDVEALRLLIKLGFEKISTVMPSVSL